MATLNSSRPEADKQRRLPRRHTNEPWPIPNNSQSITRHATGVQATSYRERARRRTDADVRDGSGPQLARAHDSRLPRAIQTYVSCFARHGAVQLIAVFRHSGLSICSVHVGTGMVSEYRTTSCRRTHPGSTLPSGSIVMVRSGATNCRSGKVLTATRLPLRTGAKM